MGLFKEMNKSDQEFQQIVKVDERPKCPDCLFGRLNKVKYSRLKYECGSCKREYKRR